MPESTDEVHDLPLAHRLINEAVGTWLDTHLRIAECACEPEEQAILNRVRHLHLAGFDYQVTPKLVEQLQRAGLLGVNTTQPLPLTRELSDKIVHAFTRARVPSEMTRGLIHAGVVSAPV